MRLNNQWSVTTPLRTDYARRYALVELDVMTAVSLGMTLQDLISVYEIQFPVLQQHEDDTWYIQPGLT